jgi:hypothetical protein
MGLATARGGGGEAREKKKNEKWVAWGENAQEGLGKINVFPISMV